MATNKAEDVGDWGVSLGQKMMSAVSGSVLTSLLGESPPIQSICEEVFAASRRCVVALRFASDDSVIDEFHCKSIEA
jgi:hypothetical protein